ncbi:MAG: hypothetical protein AAF539_06810, partial [Planctomycetota bacterium]
MLRELASLPIGESGSIECERVIEKTAANISRTESMPSSRLAHQIIFDYPEMSKCQSFGTGRF